MKRMMGVWILLFLCCFSPCGATADDGDQKRCKEFYRLGVLNLGTEDGNEHFKKAIAADPSFPAPRYWVAYDAVRVGNDSEAIRGFEAYLAVAKGNQEQGRIEVAKEILRELQSGEPGPEIEKIRQD